MSSIFELTLEQQQLLDSLYWDSEDQESLDRLNKVRGHIEYKLSYLTDILAEARAEVATRKTALDEAKKRLEKRYKCAVSAEERVKKYLLESMVNAGIDKIEGRFINVRSIPHDAPKYTDEFNPENLLPVTYEGDPLVKKNVEYKLSDRMIVKAIKGGYEIHGVFVVNEPFLKEV